MTYDVRGRSLPSPAQLIPALVTEAVGLNLWQWDVSLAFALKRGMTVERRDVKQACVQWMGCKRILKCSLVKATSELYRGGMLQNILDE